MLTIKVLGPGCANCKKLAAVAEKVVNGLGIEAEIVKVTDYADIMAYNVLATPGLVVNEQLVAAGRIPREQEVTAWIHNAAVAE